MGTTNRHVGMLIASIAMALLPTMSIADAPATQPTSIVQGKVTAEGDVPLSEMIVYLESADPVRTFAPSTQPVKISQKEAQFDPKVAIVAVGQAVVFLNDEQRAIEHNVFSNSNAKQFDLGLYGPGESKSVTFDKPGAVFLYCSIHRYMDGVVFVAPTPFYCRVDPKAHYEIADVPAGKWTIRTWQRRRRFAELSVPVTVDSVKSTDVPLELKRK